MALAILNKAILKITGNNVKSLLDGLITQDIQKLTPQSPIYSLFLNNKGRVLYSTIIYMQDEANLLLEIEPELLMDLAKHIHKFDINKQLEFNQEELAIAICDELKEDFFCDPRHKKLPFRGFVNAGINSDKVLLERYEDLRLELAVPENYDFIKEKSLANDLNIENLNGISFSKGCYLGQEITSKTKHIRQTKNQLVSLNNLKLQINKPNQELFSMSGEKIGQTFSYNSKFVLAIIKRGTKLSNIKI